MRVSNNVLTWHLFSTGWVENFICGVVGNSVFLQRQKGHGPLWWTIGNRVKITG